MGQDHGSGWLYRPSPSPYGFPTVTQESSSRSHGPQMANRQGLLRVQDFELKSQIFFAKQTSADFAGFFCLRPIMGHRIPNFLLKKKIGGKVGSCAPKLVANKLRTLVYFSFQRNSTTQIVYLTSAEKKILGGTQYSDLCLSGTHLLVLCSGLLLIQWFSLGFLLKIFFFGGTRHRKMCA